MSNFLRNIEHFEKFEIFFIGEKLREALNDANLIKNRKYHLRTYRNCIVGKELVDWVVKNRHCDSRQGALEGLRILKKYGVVHHVCDDHDIKDEALFYRFRKDDDTVRENADLCLFYKAYDIFNGLSARTCGIMRSYQQDGELYRNAFQGAEFVDFLFSTGHVSNREDGVRIGRNLLENELIRHVTDDFHFRDDRRLLYQYTVDMAGSRQLREVFNYLPSAKGPPTHVLHRMRSRGPEEGHQFFTPTSTPECSPELARRLFKKTHDDASASASNDVAHDVRDRHFSGDSGNDTDCSETAVEKSSTRSVLLRHATVHELQSPDTPYIKQTIKVQSDPVGYGFVVRGNCPAYVQAVDPMGPAAAAGLKVRQYIYSVNGHYVLTQDHKAVGKFILDSENLVTLIVMTHRRDARFLHK
ncbi:DEP domain-containing mTOR-interacting protein-like [Mya arenaria]|uniref:DEP domain-containing mTOR-interacting protein-like n=1 Tax=Mya arenaria TaxID=6604 RepID=UPI0022E6B87A|nr:DEP domain-containing mTOR-interacting protein-like [Mya arenaria]